MSRLLHLCVCFFVVLLLVGQTARADVYGFSGEDGAIYLSDTPSDDRFELLAVSPAEPANNIAPVSSSRLREMNSQANPGGRFAFLPYHDFVKDAAETYRLDSALLHAVITAESNYNPRAISAKGAVGLMQLMPGTARLYGVTNSYDPAQNIQGGARYLSYLLGLFNNDLKLALAAYNAGENSVLRYGRAIPPFRETTDYVRKVSDLYRRYAQN